MMFFRHPILTALIGAILFAVSLDARVHLIPAKESVSTTTPKVATLRERTEARALQDAWKALPLEAQAAVVWDAESGAVLFGKKEEAQLPLASLTKVMLAYTADQVIADDTRITMTGKDLAEEGSSGIAPGESFRYADLRAATLVASLNDGANAMSRTMGEVLMNNNNAVLQKQTAIDLMNASARQLHLAQTYFYNEDGLDLGVGQPGAIGSAKDIARLFFALLIERPKTLLPTTQEGYLLRAFSGTTYQYWNTNQTVKDIPGLLGSKTGYTALADGNLAIAFAHEGRTLVVVVLGSTKEGRFEDVKAIVEFLKKHAFPKLADAHGIIETSL